MAKRYRVRRGGLVLAGVWCGVSVLGCGREPRAGDESAVAETSERRHEQRVEPVALEPFVERIAGTTVEFRMVPVEAGVLEMNAPEGPGTVEIAGFYVGETEVTWDLFDVYLYGLDVPEGGEEARGGEDGADAVTRPSKPYVPPDRGFGHAGFPAISMTYQSAERFCEWLSAKTGRTYRLPTEAEWSLVAQRCADDAWELDAREWYLGNADAQTHAVAQKRACDLGVHDLLGNAAEWATGWDGTPILCGGAYSDDAAMISSATRRKQTPAWNMSDPQMPKSRWWLPDAPFVGFRVVCEIEQGAGDD